MLVEMSNYLKGSVRISVEGAAIERFLNLCAVKKADFWDIKRIDDSKIEATVSVTAFFIIGRWAARSMCTVKVIKKQGFPFVGRALTRRFFLWGGALLCVAIIWALSGFVWTIEIIGRENLSERAVLEILAQNGLQTGTALGAVDSDEIKNKVLSASDNISWLAVNLQGTHARVEIEEKMQTPEGIASDMPCDIISQYDGVIERLRVTEGRAVAEVGQTVQSGDRLASGTLADTHGRVWYVHAQAQADLRVWSEQQIVMLSEYILPIETGNSKTTYSFVIGNMRFDAHSVEKSPYEWYYKTVERNYLSLHEDFRLPIAIIKETWVECTPSYVSVEEQAASEHLYTRALEMFALTLPQAQLQNDSFETELRQGLLTASLSTEYLITAGQKAPLAEESYDRTND